MCASLIHRKKIHMYNFFYINIFQLNKINLIIGFCSPALTPFTKAFLYTTYLRPYLLYGIGNYNLNINETKSIKRAESNCLKIALKLSTRIKTTELLLALKILSTKHYTRSIIEEILKSGNQNKITNSFVNEIFKITRSISLDINKISNQCALKLNQYKTKFDHEIKTNVRSHIVKHYLEQLDYHFAITDLRKYSPQWPLVKWFSVPYLILWQRTQHPSSTIIIRYRLIDHNLLHQNFNWALF